jgi:hypothetical protein
MQETCGTGGRREIAKQLGQFGMRSEWHNVPRRTYSNPLCLRDPLVFQPLKQARNKT